MANSRPQEASSSTSRCTYHAFLSFRGEDTRKNFTDHLYTALVHAGICTFRDDDELEKGEDIRSELSRAIQQSRISIIVLSKGYASSSWCLDELLKILERRRTVGHMVLPVFYGIDPSQLKETGSFFHLKEENQEMDKVERWRAGLKEVADLEGMVLQNPANGHESQFIQNIVKEIGKKLRREILMVAPYQVGIDSRVREINLWLQDGSTSVDVALICGVGGIGKTNIAKTVYNLNYDSFDGSSFLANVREEASKQPNGLIRLQKQLLSDILKGVKNKIYNVDEGIIKIKDAVCCKKVLLVLDDVDQLEQLNALLGVRDWFYPGSKIIVTTRNGHLIECHEGCHIFKVKELDDDESLQLFNWHAFGQGHPMEGYMEHSKSFVHHCGGLPLALRVLGSSVSGKEVDVWESALQKLKAIPNGHILKILRISYDSLKDSHDKSLFLDIVCFFLGEDKEYTTKILYGCDFNATVGIQNLIDRGLVTIEIDNKLAMHQLLRDMGREIIRQESPKEPGKRSRLWNHEDAFNLLSKKTGTKAIEGLILDSLNLAEDLPAKAIFSVNNKNQHHSEDFLDKSTPAYQGSSLKGCHLDCLSRQSVYIVSAKSCPISNEGDLSTDAFAMMYKLRVLQLNYVRLVGGYEDFPKELKWLRWHGFHLESIPKNFSLEKLVALDLRNSSLKYVWKGTRFLQKLKFLNLSHSHSLTETPDFSELSCLERLMLKDCVSLVKIHESVGCLQSLIILNLKGCKNLRKLPQDVVMLNSLEELILSGCSKLDELPEEMAKMEGLVMLYADNTAINQLPTNTGDLKKLNLSASSWHSIFWSLVSPQMSRKSINSSLYLPSSLVNLSLADCNLSENDIAGVFSGLPLLLDLNLSGNQICCLPETINVLGKLEALQLNRCTNLRLLPELPTALEELHLLNCTSLETLPNLPNLLRSLYLDVYGCDKLVEFQGLFKLDLIGNIDAEIINNLGLLNLESVGSIEVEMANCLTLTKKKCPLQGLYECGIFSIFLPGREVPDWFSNKSMETIMYFVVPQHPNLNIQGLNLCVVYALCKDFFNFELRIYIRINNVTKGCYWTYNPCFFAVPKENEDMMWLSHWKFGSQLEDGDKVIISVDMGSKFQIKECGVHIACEQDEKGTWSNRNTGYGDGDATKYEVSPGAYFLCNHWTEVWRSIHESGMSEELFEELFL